MSQDLELIIIIYIFTNVRRKRHTDNPKGGDCNLKTKTIVMLSLRSIFRRWASAKKLMDASKNPQVDARFSNLGFELRESKDAVLTTEIDEHLGVPVSKYVFKNVHYALRGFPYPKRVVFYVGKKRARVRRIAYMGDSAYWA